MFKFKELKNGSVSVYKNDILCCIIDINSILIKSNETPMDYCRRVFKND